MKEPGAPIGVGDCVVLPDNRWDLVDGEPAELPTVAVVVPYYNQQEQLALVLEALTAQTYPLELVDVVVADDGSAEQPDVGRWQGRLRVSVVSQQDKGFRAAAARNMGARASSGAVLCFLDADTIPTPDYLRRAVRLPACAPDCVVVGRRGHADLTGVSPEALPEWIAGERELGEPQWLVDGYERTAGLLEPGMDGYKYILSAVLTCSRELFDDIGGFDERFVGYGGEDWEFANRAFVNGAVFAYAPAAIAWHDGPDWSERAVPDRVSQKNAEALALAPVITDPAARTAGLRFSIPDVAVVLSTDGHTAASLLRTMSSILRGSDCAIWLPDDEVSSQLQLFDSRVRVGEPEPDVLARCRFVAHVSGRVVFSEHTTRTMIRDLGPGGVGAVIVEVDGTSVDMVASRAAHRARRWSGRVGSSEKALIEALFGVRRRRAEEVGLSVVDDEPWLAW